METENCISELVIAEARGAPTPLSQAAPSHISPRARALQRSARAAHHQGTSHTAQHFLVVGDTHQKLHNLRAPGAQRGSQTKRDANDVVDGIIPGRRRRGLGGRSVTWTNVCPSERRKATPSVSRLERHRCHRCPRWPVGALHSAAPAGRSVRCTALPPLAARPDMKTHGAAGVLQSGAVVHKHSGEMSGRRGADQRRQPPGNLGVRGLTEDWVSGTTIAATARTTQNPTVWSYTNTLMNKVGSNGQTSCFLGSPV
ncbi:unnamed protein product [Boreogadus saida]